MDERVLDVVTLTYMTVFLFTFGGILLKAPKRTNLLDTALTALIFVLGMSYLRSLLGLYAPIIFDTTLMRTAIRIVAMVTLTVSVFSLWRELRASVPSEWDQE